MRLDVRLREYGAASKETENIVLSKVSITKTKSSLDNRWQWARLTFHSVQRDAAVRELHPSEQRYVGVLLGLAHCEILFLSSIECISSDPVDRRHRFSLE